MGNPSLVTPVVPLKQTAIVQDAKGAPQLARDVEVPRLEAGTMLVRTVAVALNPVDYKMGAAFPTPGALMGMDYSGIIVSIHPETETDLRVGDAVCGMVHGSNPANPDNGAFTEYIRVRAELVLRVPQGGESCQLLTMKQAATLGVGLMTNIMALWDPSGLALAATPDAPAEKPFPVLVYGGSTATGTLATQLLNLSGLRPVITCSSRNFDLAYARGAVTALDYAAPDMVENVRAFAGGKLKYAYDCIADPSSVAHCYAAIGRTGGRYVSLEQVPQELLCTRRAVHAKFALAYEAFGRFVPLPKGHGCIANPEKAVLAARHLRVLQGLLDKGILKTHPVQELSGGLLGVLEGLKLLKSGSVSGKKLVVVLRDCEKTQSFGNK
ncbi:GroES-like protein [Xylariaceae sp. AK1471]|nr:GroES-like protein [Xylariaceae sp. AK1471]